MERTPAVDVELAQLMEMSLKRLRKRRVGEVDQAACCRDGLEDLGEIYLEDEVGAPQRDPDGIHHGEVRHIGQVAEAIGHDRARTSRRISATK